MADGGFDLSKNVGPLPAGVWAVIIAGGLGVAYFINRRSAANQANTPVQLTEGGTGAGGSGFDVVNPPPPATAEPDTNEKWRVRVTNWLIANGYDPTTADNAVRKYLFGQSLSIAEEAVINVALVQFGVPPEPVSGPEPTGPAPVSGLTGTATGPKNLILNWIPVIGAASYKITQGGTGVGTDVNVTAPPYIRSDLTPGTTNVWTVVSVNDFGASEPRTVTVVQPGEPTPPPTGGSGENGHHHGGGGGGGTPSPPSPPPPAQRWHIVAPGETLQGISLLMYGTSSRWIDIYNANAAGIEEVARQHGKQSSRGPNGTPGWWIWPGENMLIP
jgi:hypothetical protein